MKSLVLLFTVLLSTAASANIVSLSFGPSVDDGIGVNKMLALDYEVSSGAPALIFDFGEYNEPSGIPAIYAGVSGGIHIVAPSGLTSRISFGPVLVSETDSRISSPFEFHIQARLGLDLHFWETGLEFDHFSNAGLVPPNLGRDVVSLYVGIPL